MEQEVQYSSHITQKLPIDQQGFVQSFSIDEFDPTAVRQFFEKFGLVVFNDVLSKDEVKKSVDDLWKDESQWGAGKVDRNDPETWKYVGGKLGFINHKPIVQSQLCKNRSHPKVYKAFKTIYELSSGQNVNEPLIAMFDRGSILKPSKNNPEWKAPPFHHFDIHPWWWTKVIESEQTDWRRYNKYDSTFEYWLAQGNYIPKVRNFTKIQGVLGLSATNPQSGGFEVVCGFHKYIKEWCQKYKQFTLIQNCPQLVDNMQKIYQRPGSIIFFSRQLPHNIYPNISQSFRYAQYLRMAPQSCLMLTPEQKSMRQVYLKKLMHKDQDRKDPIVRQVYMLGPQQRQQRSWFQSVKDSFKKMIP